MAPGTFATGRCESVEKNQRIEDPQQEFTGHHEGWHNLKKMRGPSEDCAGKTDNRAKEGAMESG
jgi:hypothetical protein